MSFGDKSFFIHLTVHNPSIVRSFHRSCRFVDSFVTLPVFWNIEVHSGRTVPLQFFHCTFFESINGFFTCVASYRILMWTYFFGPDFFFFFYENIRLSTLHVYIIFLIGTMLYKLYGCEHWWWKAPSVFTLQALQQVAVMGKMTAVLYKALP